MKIVTVNLPEKYIEEMDKLVKNKELYPSRSELIRCATRDFIKKELTLFRNMQYKKKEQKRINQDPSLVQIPIELKDENNEPVHMVRTYKVVKKLDTSSSENKKYEMKPFQQPEKMLNVFPRNLYYNYAISHLYEKGELDAKGLGLLLGVVQSYAGKVMADIMKDYPGLIIKKQGYRHGNGKIYSLDKNVLERYYP